MPTEITVEELERRAEEVLNGKYLTIEEHIEQRDDSE